MSALLTWGLRALIVAALVGTIITAYKGWENKVHASGHAEGAAEIRALWDAQTIVSEEIALKESEAQRAKENAKTLANTRIQNALIQEKSARLAADGLAADSLQRLNAAVAAITPGADQTSTDTDAASGTDDPRNRIIAECAITVTGLDATARRLQAKTIGLQAYAGEVCLTP